MKRVILFLFCLCIALPSVSQAAPRPSKDSTAALWTRATDFYSSAQYAEALELYASLEKQGIESASLYFNMGNCYFKNNDIPRAILYYERTLLLQPNHKDAAYNLSVAQSYCIDKIDPVPEFFLFTWFKKLRNSLSSDTWAWTSLVLLALALVLILFFFFARHTGFRKTAFVFSMIFMLFALGCGIFSYGSRHAATREKYAIVYAAVSSVKSSPDAQGKDLLVVHEGTKVCVMEKVGDWSRIELADGRQGWIISNEIVYL